MLLSTYLKLALIAATGLIDATKILPRQQQTPGTPLFLDEPSCNSYQCAVTFRPGDNATAHWLDAPAGNVVLVMTSRTSTITDQNVATVPGTTTNCNKETGNTCGQFSWIVPSSWVGGNFTLQATSQDDPSVTSYTDTILVVANPDNATDVPFRALDPTAGSSSTSASPTASTSSQTGAPSSIALTSSATTPTGTAGSSNAGNGASTIHASLVISILIAVSAASLAAWL